MGKKILVAALAAVGLLAWGPRTNSSVAWDTAGFWPGS